MRVESGWETISRRRGKASRSDSWASRVKAAAAERRESSPLKEDSIGGKAVSFYISNFPEIWNDDEIWRALKEAGNIVDLYIAKKRNAKGRKFGFARYFGVRDATIQEQRLNNIWMKKLRLKANIARFGRKESKKKIQGKASVPPVETRTIKSAIVKTDMPECSYAEAVKGRALL
ncbi:hypothetical protein LXL04_001655 [Taraxacum kok-saghyz]